MQNNNIPNNDFFDILAQNPVIRKRFIQVFAEALTDTLTEMVEEWLQEETKKCDDEIKALNN